MMTIPLPMRKVFQSIKLVMLLAAVLFFASCGDSNCDSFGPLGPTSLEGPPGPTSSG